MPDYRSTGREPRRDYDERYARSAPRNGARPQGSRPQGYPPQGQRPPQNRRPAPRRRKKRIMPRFFFILALLILLALALMVILGGGTDEPAVQPTPVSSVTATAVGTPDVSQPISQPAETMNYSTLSELLGNESSDTAAIAATVAQVEVTDLCLNPSLPEEWLNILLLGTDERTPSECARTDTMIICSINRNSGEVKLTSILRDMAVTFEDLGEYNGTYRINSANFFGGPEYAMKTVNDCFDMNIQHYVTVNFFGFQKIADALGGIEVDITEAEMNEINKKQLQQYRIGKNLGIAVKEDYQLLETYGPNTHLDGNQTLAYARVRAIDSDVSRAERQRTVLTKLMGKLKGRSVTDIAAMAASLSSNVSMNLDLNTVVEIAYKVLSSGIPSIETQRLPAAGTYKEERRSEQAMLYDTDYATNALNLYNFIYE